jgi:hypothetical protein
MVKHILLNTFSLGPAVNRRPLPYFTVKAFHGNYKLIPKLQLLAATTLVKSGLQL